MRMVPPPTLRSSKSGAGQGLSTSEAAPAAEAPASGVDGLCAAAPVAGVAAGAWLPVAGEAACAWPDAVEPPAEAAGCLPGPQPAETSTHRADGTAHHNQCAPARRLDFADVIPFTPRWAATG